MPLSGHLSTLGMSAIVAAIIALVVIWDTVSHRRGFTIAAEQQVQLEES